MPVTADVHEVAGTMTPNILYGDTMMKSVVIEPLNNNLPFTTKFHIRFKLALYLFTCCCNNQNIGFHSKQKFRDQSKCTAPLLSFRLA